jgi:hypothetical protein
MMMLRYLLKIAYEILASGRKSKFVGESLLMIMTMIFDWMLKNKA